MPGEKKLHSSKGNPRVRRMAVQKLESLERAGVTVLPKAKSKSPHSVSPSPQSTKSPPVPTPAPPHPRTRPTHRPRCRT